MPKQSGREKGKDSVLSIHSLMRMASTQSSDTGKSGSSKQTPRALEATWINFPQPPKSEYVMPQKGGKYLNPWVAACDLIEKYVQNSSMLCINVSWNVREAVLKFMEQYMHLYEQHYGKKLRRRSSLSISFSRLSWKRNARKKSKGNQKTAAVDDVYQKLEDAEHAEENGRLEESLSESTRDNEPMDEESVLKELAAGCVV